MSVITDKETRTYPGGRYLVTSEGYVIVWSAQKGSYIGRVLLPQWKNNSAQYFITTKGRQKALRLTDVVREAWGIEIAATHEDVLYMRSVVNAHNDEVLNLAQEQRNAPDKPAEDAEIAEQVVPEVCPQIHMPPLNSEAGFIGMATGFTDYKSWDCPEMDPMSCGSWWVRIEIDWSLYVAKEAA